MLPSLPTLSLFLSKMKVSGHIPYIGDCDLPRAKIKKLHAVEIEWVCEKNRVYIYDVFKYHLTTNTFALITVLS